MTRPALRENPLVLTDYREYARLVADAYDARPVREPAALASYVVLLKHVMKLWQRIRQRIRFVFVAAPEPYTDAAEMTERVARDGVMYVSTLFSENLASGWTPKQNHVFRAVHDYVVHIGGRHPFTLRGELGAYNRHAKLVPPAALPALFAEVAAQTCYFIDRGAFPSPQKACIIHGVDFVRVGVIDPGAFRRNYAVGARLAGASP